MYSRQREPRVEEHTVRGLRHRVLRWGPHSSSPIVMLHGFLDVADTWQFLVDELPADWSFVAPDWRGFGGSEWPADGYWFPDYLADLEAMLELLVPGEPARIIGHSMGGNIATVYGGVRPQRLQWIVDLEGFGLPRTTSDQAPDRLVQWLDQLARPPRQGSWVSTGELAQRLRDRNPRLTVDRAAFIAAAWTRPRDAAFELVSDPRHRLVNPVLYRREENEACWRRCAAPVFLLLGEHSEFRERLGDDGTGEFLGSVLPRATVATVPGVGHMMHHEDPARVAREIGAFLASLAQSSLTQ